VRNDTPVQAAASVFCLRFLFFGRKRGSNSYVEFGIETRTNSKNHCIDNKIDKKPIHLSDIHEILPVIQRAQ
jgi:hypothetical protein